jgi:hypothetical protein
MVPRPFAELQNQMEHPCWRVLGRRLDRGILGAGAWVREPVAETRQSGGTAHVY